MKAVVFHGVGDIRLEDVPDPKIENDFDAVVKITRSAICGTDLHMVRGTMPGMEPGTILGHEGVGIVEDIGKNVRNFKAGDRVVIPSTIACGYCSYCRAGYFAQCDNANPNGKRAGTAFFGGPKMSGPFHGLQAEKARIPFAGTGLVRLPNNLSDDQAILLSDIFPTGYFGADLAEIDPGDTVVVFGCGPVGLFCIESAKLMDAGRIMAVDRVESRLEIARDIGAEVIDFSKEDPVEVILELTGGIGADRIIDAVGVDSEAPHSGPAAEKAEKKSDKFQKETQQVVSDDSAKKSGWNLGDAPSQALSWCVDGLAKAGTLAIVGAYPQTMESFPIGQAMMKNLTINMGNCNHRKYIPMLIDLVAGGSVDLSMIISQEEPLTAVLDAYKKFDEKQSGWIKVQLIPGK
jgi:threonine dehydrogenase-like Zn-dependent dehydrogenase